MLDILYPKGLTKKNVLLTDGMMNPLQAPNDVSMSRWIFAGYLRRITSWLQLSYHILQILVGGLNPYWVDCNWVDWNPPTNHQSTWVLNTAHMVINHY